MAISRVIKSDKPAKNTKEQVQGSVIEDTPKYKELEPAPKEIQALMSSINEILSRGEDVPDSLVKEFEIQMKVSGDFNVSELMDAFALASEFYGIRGVLETKKRSNHNYLIKKFEDDIKRDPNTPHPIVEDIPPMPDEPPMPDVPQQSDEELMESMSARSHIDDQSGHEHIDIQGNIHQALQSSDNQELSNIPPNEVVERAKYNESIQQLSDNSSENTQQADNSAARLAVERAIQDEVPIEKTHSITKDDSFFPKASLSKDKRDVEQARAIEPQAEHITYQQGSNNIFKPLISSFMTPFAAMLGMNSKKQSAETHLSKESFQDKSTNNRIADFKSTCAKHAHSIDEIVSLGKKYHESGNEIDKGALVSEIDRFTNQSIYINKEFNRLESKVDKSSTQSDYLKSISKEHAEKLKSAKEDVDKYFGGNIPSSLAKLFDRAFDSIKKLVNKLFKSTSLQDSKPEPVEPISH